LRGIHHIGFQVDDLDATATELQAAGVKKVPMEMRGYEEREVTPMRAASGGALNLKYLGPDEVHFDVRQKGWDEAIGLGMQRYELTPAEEAAE
jgi:4-hydroxyphenylpyruvate dioxygenase-like putative hemolysin